MSSKYFLICTVAVLCSVQYWPTCYQGFFVLPCLHIIRKLCFAAISLELIDFIENVHDLKQKCDQTLNIKMSRNWIPWIVFGEKINNSKTCPLFVHRIEDFIFLLVYSLSPQHLQKNYLLWQEVIICAVYLAVLTVILFVKYPDIMWFHIWK